ncbi:hypothetical protein ACHQM5_005489 [Ranunculus cassubicifolius]
MKARKKLQHCSSSAAQIDGNVKKTKRIDEDRLSNLPDPILHQILSFLGDMTEVIPTSLLSKRWRYLWTSLPFLSFKSDYENFSDFVYRVLLLRDNSTIQTFSLKHSSQEWRSNDLESWIRTAVCRNVQNIDVEFNPDEEDLVVKLPHVLFTSKFLTSLKFELPPGDRCCYRLIDLPDHINLPALTTLHLGHIDLYSSNNFFNRLCLGCPALENLILVDCGCHASKPLNIYAAHLKYLKIEYCFKDESINISENSMIVVSAPNLVCFSWTLTTDDYCSVVFENPSALETAQVYLVDEDVYENTEHSSRMIRFLKGLYNVKYLILPDYLLQAASLYPSELEQWTSPFTKLRVLHLATWHTKGCFEAFVFLLKNSPTLESLDLDMDPHYKSSDNKVDLEQVGSSFKFKMYQLKYITVKEVIGCDLELPYLKFLLEYAVELKSMTIFIAKKNMWRYSHITGDLKTFTKEVLAVPRASSNAEVFFDKMRNAKRKLTSMYG